MPQRYSFGDAVLDVEPGPKVQPEEVEPERPFRVLILGDFTGRASRGVFETGRVLRPVSIDRDNFDEVLESLRPALRLPVPGSATETLTLEFRSLDDFHPDALYDSCEWLRGLAASAPAPPAAAAPSANLTLDELLDGPATPVPQNGSPDPFDRMLRELVAPHGLPRHAEPAPPAAELLTGLRALLHLPPFQALEAAWRALRYLVRRVETGGDLELAILDISRAELADDLEASRENPRASAVWRVVVDDAARTLGAGPWSVIAGNYSFTPQEEDLQLLARMGEIARQGGAPFVAAASPQVLDNLTGGAFRRLRASPHASWIGLVVPRWLLRLPYGADTKPTERLPFEEMEHPEHEAYLWGNPAFACACLLAQAFSSAGWDMRPGEVRDLDDLPLHIYKEGGHTKVKPCAEILMTESAAEALLDFGIMPLVSFKDRDMVRLLRFQSIADPPAALSGPWD